MGKLWDVITCNKCGGFERVELIETTFGKPDPEMKICDCKSKKQSCSRCGNLLIATACNCKKDWDGFSGWICPKCKAGINPLAIICPCSAKQK